MCVGNRKGGECHSWPWLSVLGLLAMRTPAAQTLVLHLEVSGPEFISRLDYISPTPYSTNAHFKLVFSGEERKSEQGQGCQSALRPLHLIPCLLHGCPSSLSLKTQVSRRRVGHPCSMAPPGPAPGSRPAVPSPVLVPLLPSILAHWRGCRELH